MEEELLRSQKLESVGLLAGGIAHDFNNILTTILGNVSMAKMQVAPEDEMFDLLKEAETASIRAQTLTKQLLTFAKGGTPIKETASIKDILKESSRFVLRGSKSSCKFSIAEDLWPAEVDVGQMSQVIDNIVINANQAMPYRTTENVIAGVVITFIDVHKVKQADKIRRLATVLEDSNDAITIVDLEGNILAWNKGAQQIYGWTESEALKMNISELVPEDKQIELKSFIEKIERGESITSIKSQRKTRAGKILDVWLTVTALTDESGRPIEIATTERDLAWLAEK